MEAPGGDGRRGPSGRGRWVALIAGFAALIAVIAVQHYLTGGSGASSAAASTSTSAPSPPGTIRSAPIPTGTAGSNGPPTGSAASTGGPASVVAPAAPSPQVSAGSETITGASPSGAPSGDNAPGTTTVGKGVLPGATGWDVVAYGAVGVVRYRPADGTVTVTPVPSLNSTGPYSFVATLRGSILRPLDSVPGYAIPVGGRAIELSGLLDAEGPLLAGPKPGQLWVAHGPGAAANLVLVDPEGRRLGPTISLSSIGVNDWPAPDGSGYALVSSGSGIYDARPDGLRLVTHGIVLAAGPTGFLVYECSDDAKCGVAVVDAAGASRHPIDGIVLTDHQRVRRGIISPDGAFAAFSETVTGQTSHSELHLINLASGLDRVVIDALDTAQSPGFTPAFAFSPDGSWLLFATHSGQLDALDTTTGAITVLPTAIPPVSAVLVQPTS